MCTTLENRLRAGTRRRPAPSPGFVPRAPAVTAPVAGDLAFQRNQTMRRSLFEGVGG